MKLIKTNPELKTLLDEYENPASRDELKKSIEQDGIRDPIIVWKETNEIVDGHNRYDIGKELGIDIPTTFKSFKDVGAVKEFMLRNQLGRRNLTPARFNYYLGRLYNETKEAAIEKAAENPDPAKKAAPIQETAEKLAKEFDVSEKTVRRLGEQAKGIDTIEKIKGKLAAAKQLTSKPEYTTEEVEVISKASNQTVAAKVIDKIDSIKKVAQVKKVADKQIAAAVKEKAVLYQVALVQPDFGTGFSPSTEPRPTLDKDASVWMIVPDEHLMDAAALIKSWGLEFQATFVYYSSKTYEGVFSKIAHQFVFLATRGHIIGPDKGKEQGSVTLQQGDIMPSVFKLIDTYCMKNTRRIDMRRGVKAIAGYDTPATK